MEIMIWEFLISTVAVFALTVLLTHWLIPYLKSKKMGQKILEIGPRWHKSKDGTPTMGGVAFILATLLVMCGMAIYMFFFSDASEMKPLALTLGLATINGLIGIIDDRCKLLKKENQGLLPYQKFALQVIAAGLYLFALNRTGYIDTSVRIPFTEFELELGIFYYVFAILLVVGIVNSANLTDGIDGLASGVTCVVGCFFAALAFSAMHTSLALASAAIIGSTLGFLVYNFNPARIFMGDTGSLFLGGMVVGCAFMINDPLIIVICGLIYIIEALSVMIQVGVFKITHGHRVFKMAPIHHHFEKCGWSERKVFGVFCAVTLVCCVIAWFAV